MKRLARVIACLTITMQGLSGLSVKAQTPAQPAVQPSTNAPSAPATEAYKPDPIATTSQALQGKLFFNDAERARTDKARKDLAAGKIVVTRETANDAPVLSGFVKRSDGVTTYWINGGGANDTRFVTGTDKKASNDISATSTMVGGEPKFVLRGTTVGGKEPINPKSKIKAKETKTKKATAKKSKVAPTKERKKNKRIGEQK